MRGFTSISTIVLTMGLTLGGALAPARAEAGERNTALHMGLGILAFACTLPYGTLKSFYAVAGTITGGVAWALTGGNSDIARDIIQPAIRGDYVVVPENLTMEKALTFSGRDPAIADGYSPY